MRLGGNLNAIIDTQVVLANYRAMALVNSNNRSREVKKAVGGYVILCSGGISESDCRGKVVCW